MVNVIEKAMFIQSFVFAAVTKSSNKKSYSSHFGANAMSLAAFNLQLHHGVYPVMN